MPSDSEVGSTIRTVRYAGSAEGPLARHRLKERRHVRPQGPQGPVRAAIRPAPTGGPGGAGRAGWSRAGWHRHGLDRSAGATAWGTPGNWTNQANPADHHVPISGVDGVSFNSAKSTQNCVYAGGALTLTSLTFTNAYAGTFQLTISATGLTVTGATTLSSNANPNLTILGAGSILGTGGQLNAIAGSVSTFTIDQVWVGGGGTNEGSVALNVDSFTLNSSYTLKGTFRMLRSGSCIANWRGKTLTITPGADGAYIKKTESTLFATPFFINHGTVVVNSGQTFFNEVPFYNGNSPSTPKLTVKDGANLQILTNDATSYAYWQGAAGAVTEVEEGAFVWASNDSTDNDSWIQYGALNTIDVAGKDTAEWRSHNLYVGMESGYGTNYATIDVTQSSNTAGILKNANGNITLYNSAKVVISLFGDGFATSNDKIITNYQFNVKGTLVLQLLGEVPTIDSFWTSVISAAPGEMTGTWGSIIEPEKVAPREWRISYNPTDTTMRVTYF